MIEFLIVCKQALLINYLEVLSIEEKKAFKRAFKRLKIYLYNKIIVQVFCVTNIFNKSSVQSDIYLESSFGYEINLNTYYKAGRQ